MSPIQWLWLQSLRVKIAQGKHINLNGSRIGRDSVEELITFVDRLIKADREALLKSMPESDRQEWRDFWDERG